MNEKTFKAGAHTLLPHNAVIHIIPRLLGTKNGGFFNFIAGAALVVIGCVMTVISGGSASPLAVGLISAGVGMMVGGVVMMLTKIPGTPTSDDSSNNKNTAFSNLDNTIAQGTAVPLCYGKMMIGSKVLSQGIETL
ncbi:tail assembly protein [Zophobihabitans entericus]|nr:tail assembly protein [Zophobihabitans entericus]